MEQDNLNDSLFSDDNNNDINDGNNNENYGDEDGETFALDV